MYSKRPAWPSSPPVLSSPWSAQRGRCLGGSGTRQHVGRVILLGLEVLIIADIVQTITIDPTLESALTLALIVLVRTFLSFSLEIELHGRVPWRTKPTADDSDGSDSR
jgi:Protein of unknown function (DUF1622)